LFWVFGILHHLLRKYLKCKLICSLFSYAQIFSSISTQTGIDIDSVDPYLNLALKQFEQEIIEEDKRRNLHTNDAQHFKPASCIQTSIVTSKNQVIFANDFEHQLYNTLLKGKLDHRLFSFLFFQNIECNFILHAYTHYTICFYINCINHFTAQGYSSYKIFG
jgi:hypothetical protein